MQVSRVYIIGSNKRKMKYLYNGPCSVQDACSER